MSLQADITKDDGFFVGEDKRIVFDVTDTTVKVRPPVDITGWAIQWEMASTYSGPAIISVVAVVLTGPDGRCIVDIPSADTRDLPGDVGYFYSLRRVDDGSRDELAFGNCWLRDVWVDYP